MANSELLVVARTPGTGAGADKKVLRPRSRALPLLRDLVVLTKPRITALVLLTGAVGTCLAPGRVAAPKLLLSLLGTALIVASANALNMWWERDVDALMARTRNRPLPAGRMSPDLALAFGLALACISAPMLFLVNVTTGLLGLVALVTYVAAYTPLKRHTHLALLVGAVPGAMPPLMGWTTVTGSLGIGGMLLFAVLFLWQVPHFAAIAIFRADDYARAGLQVVSVQHGESAARRTMAAWTALLVGATMFFGPLGLAGRAYTWIATALGAGFLALALRGIIMSPRRDVLGPRRAGRSWAKGVFAYSILYLSVLLIALLLDRA